jgi:hypothetical protein
LRRIWPAAAPACGEVRAVHRSASANSRNFQ